MKKILTIFLLFTISLIASNTSATTYAQINEEPQNIDLMFESAKNQYYKNLKSGKSIDNDIQYFTLTNQDGEKFKVKAFKYQEKNKASNSDINQIVETYVASADKEFIEPIKENNNSNISPLLSGSNEGYDNSLGVKSVITLTYNRAAGTNNYLLTNVSGTWKIDDPKISISNRSVRMACVTPITTNQNIVKYPTSNSFNYATGFTKYATSTSLGHGLGATTSATLKRGTSSKWTFEFNYSLFNNPY